MIHYSIQNKTVFRYVRLAALVLSVWVWANPVMAHNVPLARATGSWPEANRMTVRVFCNVPALLLGEDPGQLTDAQIELLRAMSPEELDERLASAESSFAREFSMDGGGADRSEIAVIFPDEAEILEKLEMGVTPDIAPEFAVSITAPLSMPEQGIRMKFPDGIGPVSLQWNDGIAANHELVIPGQWSAQLVPDKVEAESTAMTIFNYVMLGFLHIVPNGLDHILFVVGLFLLSARMKPLLWQITAFTIAHSITLALSMYGVLSISSRIVEPLIALSIVFVAVENIMTTKLHAWRLALVFLFGLLHGLGFAGVLTELGLPREMFLEGLLSFNIGVEFGQLAVIGALSLAVGMYRNHVWYRPWIVIPGSLCTAMIGVYWAVERIFG